MSICRTARLTYQRRSRMVVPAPPQCRLVIVAIVVLVAALAGRLMRCRKGLAWSTRIEAQLRNGGARER
jgi:hypothetical protein